jgi:hypothetical protein
MKNRNPGVYMDEMLLADFCFEGLCIIFYRIFSEMFDSSGFL